VLTSGETVFQDRRVRRLPVPLALPLLAFALLLFPLDVANRRLILGSGQAAEALAAARERWQDRQAAKREAARARLLANTASVGRLMDRKARLQAEDDDATVNARAVGPVDAPRGSTARPAPRDGNGSSTPAASPSEYRSRLMDAKKRAAREADEE
jgi:hypothetical protein